MVTTSTTIDTIFKAKIDITNFRQVSNQNFVEYVQDPWSKALQCGPIYDWNRLKEFLIKRRNTFDLTKDLKLLMYWKKVCIAIGTRIRIGPSFLIYRQATPYKILYRRPYREGRTHATVELAIIWILSPHQA